MTPAAAFALYTALTAQHARCPGCHGVGRVRASGDYRSCACLVCEDVSQALSHRDKRDPNGWSAAWNNDDARATLYAQIYAPMLAAAIEFVKRCPGCYGVGQVWSAGEKRPCLVCAPLRTAIMTFSAEI